jgi:hypothetical protein
MSKNLNVKKIFSIVFSIIFSFFIITNAFCFANGLKYDIRCNEDIFERDYLENYVVLTIDMNYVNCIKKYCDEMSNLFQLEGGCPDLGWLETKIRTNQNILSNNKVLLILRYLSNFKNRNEILESFEKIILPFWEGKQIFEVIYS